MAKNVSVASVELREVPCTKFNEEPASCFVLAYILVVHQKSAAKKSNNGIFELKYLQYLAFTCIMHQGYNLGFFLAILFL